MAEKAEKKDVCLVSNYVKKEILTKIDSRIKQMELLFEKYEGTDTKGNRKRMQNLKDTFEMIDDIPLCGDDGEKGANAYGHTKEEEEVLKARGEKIKSEPKEGKKKRKRSVYQQHMSDCMKAAGPFDGEEKGDFQSCVGVWKVKKEAKG